MRIKNLLVNHLKLRKIRWAISLICLILIPFLETIALGSFYLLLTPEKVPGFKFLSILKPHYISLIPVAALAMYMFVRYLHEKNLIRLKYDAFLWDSQRLMQQFLLTSPQQLKMLDRQHFTNSLLQDSGAIGVSLASVVVITGAFLTGIAYSSYGLWISWKLFLVSSCMYILPMLVSKIFLQKMRILAKTKAKSQEKTLGHVLEMLRGFQRAKIDGLEAELSKESRSIFEQSKSWRVKRQSTYSKASIITDGLSYFGLLVVLLAGVQWLQVDLAAMFILLVLFGKLKSAFDLGFVEAIKLQDYLVQIERFDRIQSQLSQNQWDKKTFQNIEKSPIFTVEAKNISFTFQKNTPLLVDTSLLLKRGDRILIQGPSGIGKSTFVELLFGILQPDQGAVFINDEPLNRASFYKYRSNFGYSSPNVYLYDRTVRENITLGLGNQPESAIWDALDLAGLKNKILQLPDGIETVVGPNAEFFSLGEKQRLSLARIFLKRPQFLVLDEATSNLDSNNETSILNALLNKLSDQCIFIMVAHKKPAAVQFNRILYLANGSLIDSATNHTEPCPPPNILR